MLDMKYLRNNLQEVKEKLSHRGEDLSELNKFEEYDEKRRNLISETEELKAKRNEASKQISVLKKEKKDAEPAIQKMRAVGDKISALDKELKEVEESLNYMLLSIPNIPHESVPIGEDEEDNVVERKWGEEPEFPFEAQPHWDVATNLDIVDFDRAGKVTGSRFVFYKGLGARLERALINFMMDLHADQHGYTEMLPPQMVN
ncbi:serine--tRNA ligase, partial [Virgibacillus kimchii]